MRVEQHDMRGVEADVWVGRKDLLGFLLREYYVSYYASVSSDASWS